MTFLDPAAGLIGAAIAIPILIALYLLKLRRKALRVSSTLLWEQAIQDVQANVPLRWLRASWLLLLQLLALGALLVALARPAIPGVAGSAERTIIILDVSASMSATDGVRQGVVQPLGVVPAFTRLDQAKARARDIVNELRDRPAVNSRAPEAMIVTLAASAAARTRWTANPRELLDAIDAAEPTDQPGDLDSAFDLIRAVAAVDPDLEAPSPRTTALIISDGSFTPTRADRSLPGGVDFRLVQVGPATSPNGFDNLGIVAFAAKRDLEDPAVVHVFARVQNASTTPVSTTLTLRADAEPAGARQIELPPATRAADGSIIPGEASATFDLTRRDRTLITALIPRDDRLAADNAASLLLRAVKPPSLVIVGPGTDPADPYADLRGPQGVDPFLLSVLHEMDTASLTVQSIDQYQASAAAQSAGSSSPVAAADLIIFDRVAPTLPPRAPSIHIGAVPPGLGVRLSTFREGEPGFAPTRFVLWQRTHPLLRSVPLDGVLISPPMKLEVLETTPNSSTRASVLAEGTSGPLIALVEPVSGSGPRRLVLAFDLLRTNWGGDVSFPVFIAGATEFLTAQGDAAAGRSFTTTQTISLVPAPGATRVGLAGSPLSAAVPADRPGEPVNLGVAPRAGVFRVENADPSHEDPAVAVNLFDSVESTLDVRPQITVASGRSITTSASSTTEAPKREIWGVFVLLAVVLSSIEWVLYARSLRA